MNSIDKSTHAINLVKIKKLLKEKVFPSVALSESVNNLVHTVKVPLRRKFVGLFWPNSVAEYRVVSIFTQKTEQETVHPNIF